MAILSSASGTNEIDSRVIDTISWPPTWNLASQRLDSARGGNRELFNKRVHGIKDTTDVQRGKRRHSAKAFDLAFTIKRDNAFSRMMLWYEFAPQPIRQVENCCVMGDNPGRAAVDWNPCDGGTTDSSADTVTSFQDDDVIPQVVGLVRCCQSRKSDSDYDHAY